MPQSKKGPLNYRCPSCFSREIDMDMFYDEAKKEYYCLRCCYHGTEEEVLKANALVKAKYGLLDRRVDDIGLDDQPLHTHPYKKGEL